jgi:DNA-directed RNA polymerase alpha subunit
MTYTLLSCIDSKIIHNTNFYGKFELGPFSSGQSLTIANTLRRCLLSELPGTAVTLVKIMGTSHEYDTIFGVRECTLDILLNIKKLILKSQFDVYTPQVGFLNIKGPGVVRARDLNLPFFISSIDPDQYIATLTAKGKLEIKLLINCGKTPLTHSPSSKHFQNWVNLLNKAKPCELINKNLNFGSNTVYHDWKINHQTKMSLNPYLMMHSGLNLNSSSKTNDSPLNTYQKKALLNAIIAEPDPIDEHNESSRIKQTQTNKVGYFPIDANFCPINRVNYTVELKSHLTNQETIFLEIWTNGTIDPRSSIHKTVKKIIQIFLPLQQLKTSFFSNQQYSNPSFLRKKQQTFARANKPFFIAPHSGVLLKNISKPLGYFVFKTKLKKLTKLNDLFVIKTNKMPNINKQKNRLLVEQMHFSLKKKFFYLDIINLAMGPQLYFLLKKTHIHTIKDLLSTSTKQFLKIPNFKSSYLVEIKLIFKQYKRLLS